MKWKQPHALEPQFYRELYRNLCLDGSGMAEIDIMSEQEKDMTRKFDVDREWTDLPDDEADDAEARAVYLSDDF